MATEGQVVVVTGASRGIGRATAIDCAGRGMHLVLTARDSADLSDVASECTHAGAASALCIPLDLSESEGIAPLFQQVFARHGRLDGLVNNAAIMHEGLLGMIRPDDIDRVLAVNIKAPLIAMQYAARLMIRNGTGSIVNLVSIMGTNGAAGLSLYSASKAAMIGATLSAAKELAPRGIRVNAIAPGFIETDMTKGLKQASHTARIASIGMARAGTPSEVARVAGFLLGPDSAYVTGQVIGVDGKMVV